MTIQHLYPTTRPSLDLNFARTKRLDPRVTFTRGSTATYVGSDGLIKTAASNTARFDHNQTTGESLGLLVEEARTNSFLYSTELNNAYWDLATGLTKTANNAVSPDGNTTALLVTEDTSTGEHVFGKTANVSVSDNCMSIFVKPNGKTRVGFRQGTETTANVIFDLTGTGSVVSGSGFITLYPNGWFRITQVRSGSGNKTSFHLLNNADNALSYTGDGTSGCWIWGYQKEAGTFPTSFIPTTSATVTRSADVASITGTNFSSWWNASTGTFQANFRATLSGTRPVLSVDDNTANNRIELYTSTSSQKFTVTTSGTAQADITAGTASSTVINSQSAAYGSNDFSTSLNGTTAVTDTSGTVPVVTQLRIGANQAGNTTAVPIARLTYYPTRLTDAQLQALTL